MLPFFLPTADLCPCLSLPDSIKHTLASMMDVSLLKDPVFMMIGISNVFGMAGLYVPFVYLVDVAKKIVRIAYPSFIALAAPAPFDTLSPCPPFPPF